MSYKEDLKQKLRVEYIRLGETRIGIMEKGHCPDKYDMMLNASRREIIRLEAALKAAYGYVEVDR